MKKVISIIVVFVIMLSAISIEVYALSGVRDTAQGFLTDTAGSTNVVNEEYVMAASDAIYRLLLTIGTVVAVIIAAVLGIQFMIGSIEEKAKVKEALIPFVIGCIIVFGAFGIWRIVINIGNNI